MLASRAIRRPQALLAILLVTLMAGTGALIGAPSSADAAEGDITFSGRGFGHGRGMSQWGAYGYAVDYGSVYQGILDHYYRGTTLAGDAGNPEVTVELLSTRNRETLITGPGLAVNGTALGHAAVRIRGIASNTFEVLVGNACGGPWTVWTGRPGGQVATGAEVTGEIRMCEPTQVRAYRGKMIIVDGGGFQTTVNAVTIDDYVRGVVPKEVSAAWGSAGSGRGMEALKAQAVAARSYALGSQWRRYAKTCDTISCQVYMGAYTGPESGGANWIEDWRTDHAVASTSGQVRRTAAGTIARTEFSASSGGWTAGGVFPAVEDLGDRTAANPNRSWSVSFNRNHVAARLNIPAITDAKVVERNGLGADGGRVLRVVFSTTGGERSFTGNQVRSALGLKSDWFTITAVPSAGARSFTRALYIDVLGREGDPGGVDHWSGVVMRTGDRHGVARGFAGSAERYGAWISRAYASALYRAPDAGGLRNWTNYLVSGATLNDLNAGVYGSPEAVSALGGGDLNLWVAGVYQNLLGRAAAPEERTFWAGAAQQIGTAAVAKSISQASEARDRRLAEYYQVMLGRPMDASGRLAFSPALVGRGDVDVVAAIAASHEYRLRAESRFP